MLIGTGQVPFCVWQCTLSVILFSPRGGFKRKTLAFWPLSKLGTMKFTGPLWWEREIQTQVNTELLVYVRKAEQKERQCVTPGNKLEVVGIWACFEVTEEFCWIRTWRHIPFLALPQQRFAAKGGRRRTQLPYESHVAFSFPAISEPKDNGTRPANYQIVLLWIAILKKKFNFWINSQTAFQAFSKLFLVLTQPTSAAVKQTGLLL